MKWVGCIGFGVTQDQGNDIWVDKIVERKYTGSILKNRFKNQGGDINDNLTLSNRLKILADPFLQSNAGRIKYATFHGFKWRVTSVDLEYPNLILEIGDAYLENGTY